jgi:DNA polymerase III subunit delta'
MLIHSGLPALVQNEDIQSQLVKMSEAAEFDRICELSDHLAEVERGMRRNLLRALSLDALGLSLERAG